MTRAKTTAPRRALALCMSVLMLLSAWVFVAPTKTAAVNSGYDVAITVPETVYMTPQSNYNTKTTDILYYVNNILSKTGEFSVETTDNKRTPTEGKYFVYSPDIRRVLIDDVTISDAVVETITSVKSGNLFSGQIAFRLADGKGISSSQTKTLVWSIPCEMKDGSTVEFTAYTIAYAPYLSPIFTAIRNVNTENDSHYCSGLSWVSGIHGIRTAGNYYPKSNFLPLLGGPEYGSGIGNPDGWFSSDQQCGLPTAGGWYSNHEQSQDVVWVFERSAEGYVYVDSSRYTNLNMVPNLFTGLYVTDSENKEEGDGLKLEMRAYIADITGKGGYITTGTYDKSGSDWEPPSQWNTSWNKLLAGSRDTDHVNLNPWFNVPIDRATASSQEDVYIRAAMKYKQDGGGGAFNSSENDMIVTIMDSYLQVRPVNKSSLRSVYNDFLGKYNSSGANYVGSASWSNYKSKLQAAAEALGNPTTSNVLTPRNALIQAGAAPLTLNTEKTADIVAPDHADWFSFTPSESGNYMFFTYLDAADSEAYNDSKLLVYQNLDANLDNGLASNDDYSGVTNGSRMREMIGAHPHQSYSGVLSLEANTTYYIRIKCFSSTATANFPLKVCKAVNLTFNSLGGSGDITLAMPVGHTMYMDSRTGLTRTNHQLIAWSDKSSGDELMKHMASVPLTVPDTATTYNALWYPNNAPTLSASGGDYSATIDSNGEIEYYQFTPTESRKYLIYGKASADSYLLFYKDDKYYNEGLYVESQDDSTHSNGNLTGIDFGLTTTTQFFLLKPLEAGTKYLYGVKFYNTGTGTIPFRFEPVYQIHYDTNGGSGNASQWPDDQDKFIGKNRSIASFPSDPLTREGYDSLNVWNTEADGSGTDYLPGATYSGNEDLTLYAKWGPHTIHATLNDRDTTTDIYYKFEKPAYYSNPACTAAILNNTITVPVRDGYTFGGYYTGQNGTGTQCITDEGVITDLCQQLGGAEEQVTLYAYWLENTYTVTWQNWDGTVLETDAEVAYNAEPQYDGSVPTKQQTEATSYTFAGWNDGTTDYAGTAVLPLVTQDITYTAYFTERSHPYTIRFFDDDGSTQLGEDQVIGYGETPVYTGEEPTKAETPQYTYTFAGWKDKNGTEYSKEESLPSVTSDAKYTAFYTSTTKQYNITFKNDDGSVLKGPTPYDYGTFSYLIERPDNPTKTSTNELVYTFSGWTPEIKKVTADATYTATYTPSPRKYSVTFVDEDGTTVLKEATLYDYNTAAADIVKPNDPTKADTAQYTYTFAGWTPELTNVTDDVTYKATYSSSIRQYNVTFVNDNGTVLQGPTPYDYGTPAADIAKPEDPTKPAEQGVAYQFVGWSPAIAEVTADAVYTAVYAADIDRCTVTFVDEDGTVLQAATAYDYGTPAADIVKPDNPTKTATAQYTYTFAGWKAENGTEYPNGTELPPVTANAIYTAYYTAEVNQYTVTFVDEDGTTVLQEATAYDYGTPVSGIAKPANPTKAATAQYTYTFSGWSPELAPVTGNVTYTAAYSSAINEYTITWIDGDGHTIYTEQVSYGETPAYNGETPEKAATPQYTFTFTNWSPEITEVTGDATYTAQFDSTVNQYTITWVGNNDVVLQTGLVDYDVTPVYTGETPTKPATVDLSYTFVGWMPAVVPVTRNTTYTAQFRPTANQYAVTFVDEDDTVLKEATLYNYGTTGRSIEKPDDPSKESTAQYSYTFDGWYNGDSKLTNSTSITGNVTFKARYTEVANKFAVRFFGLDGAQIGNTQNVPYGSAAVAPPVPVKADDADAHGYVVDWIEDFSIITEALDVHATVTDSTPHTWTGTIVYRWDDYTACTATVGCTGCAVTKEVAATDITFAHTIEAACQTDGIDTYTAIFDIEGLTSSKTKNIGFDPNNHKTQKEFEETFSDCTNPGYTAGVQCTDCGTWLSGHDEKALADHIWSEIAYEWADDNSTCTATRVCTVDASHTESETKGASTTPVMPTECGRQGGTKYTVNFDNEAFALQEKTILAGDPLGHDWPETWTVTIDPSCTEPGEQSRTCQRCNAETETEEIPALGHNLTLVPGDPGTCLTGGTKDYYQCSRCNVRFFDTEGLNQITDESQLATEGAHDFSGEYINTNDHVSHFVMCANGCGTRSDPEYHVFDQHVTGRDYLRSKATCTEPAVYFMSCKCGEKGSATFESGEALGHAYKEMDRREATCTTDGYTAHTACERCAYKSDSYAVLPATGHGAYVKDDALSRGTDDGSLTWEAYSCSKHCGDYYMKLTVHALDANGNPLSGAAVKITDANGKVLATGTTGDDGLFKPTNTFQTGSYHFSLTYKNNTRSAWISLTNGNASASFGRFDTGNSGSGSGSGSSGSSGACKYCGQTHTGFFGWLIQFFHSILALFGLRK